MVCCSTRSSECGFQNSNRRLNDTTNIEFASIDEFPWLAILIYEKDPDLSDADDVHKFGCTGSLINGRYVLTAAQCLKLRHSFAVGVRLGEYDMNQDMDCVQDDTYSEICSNPVEDFGIEEKIIHPGYSRNGPNDIALIRLDRTVEFSTYIRPICLPTPDKTLAKAGDTLLTTSFGRLNEDADYSKIKKRVPVRLHTNRVCARVEEFVFSSINKEFSDSIMCTKELNKNLSYKCEGESGAALMFSHENQWHLEGFVIWGSDTCGPKFPYAHTKVVRYLSWINENIRPW